jgi:hypothetical protein
MISKRSFRSLLISIILPLLLLVFPARTGTAAERAKTGPVDGVKPRAAATYVKLPLSFEPNQGQTDPRVKFLSRGRGYALFLTGSDAVLSLQKPSAISGHPAHNRGPKFQSRGARSEPTPPAVLRLELAGANPAARVTGLEELPGKSNYFLGNDPKKWRTNVPTYARVKYESIYPGVDLVYYGNPSADGQLEYDFVISPGGDPRAIRLNVAVSSSRQTKDGGVKPPLRIDANSDLVVQADGGEVRFQKPVVYQPMTDDPEPQIQNRKLLEGRYVLLAGNRVGFEVPNYDKTKPLVIDPVLRYATYLGGSGLEGDASSVSVAVDASGNAYVASGTTSTNFPVTPRAFQTTNKGATVCNLWYACGDAVVAKIDPTGSQLLYSTYLGGNGDDYAYGLAVDSAGNAYVTGVTNSTDFPTTTGAFQTSPQGGYDIFVTKLNPTGSALVYSTYLGGSEDEGVQALVLDAAGDAYVAGNSSSSNFPTTAGAYDTKFDPQKAGQLNCSLYNTPIPCPYATVTKLNPTGSGLLYSTFLGGNGEDVAGALAVDPFGEAYVAGYTNSTDFPTTAGAFQPTLHAGTCVAAPWTWPCSDGFLAKLSADGSGLLYSTYLGGSGDERTWFMALDSFGNAYIVGQTSSKDFPVTAGAFQTTFGGPYVPGCPVWIGTCDDAFVAKFDTTQTGASSLVYSTYLGGSGNDSGNGIAVDSSGHAFVTGSTNSTDFPTLYPLQPANGGRSDAFITELNAAGSALISSTYLGGSGNDAADCIALDPSGIVYVAGYTESTNFPTTPGVFQPTFGGGRDLFIAKIINAISQPLIPSGGTNLYSFDNNLFNLKVTYPALASPPTTPVYLVVEPISISQADLTARLAGQFSGATLMPYDGTGGYGVLFRVTCADSSGNTIPCPNTTGVNTFYTSWNIPSGAPPISSPAFLMAPVAPIGTQTWSNIFTASYPTRVDPTVTGRTSPGFSDFVVVQNITGTPPTISITTPQNGYTYALNDAVPASYQCSGSSVVACLGDVATGSNIDTSSLGSKTFTVNAIVSSGPAAAQTVKYQVAVFQFSGFFSPVSNPPTINVIKAGRAVPIKWQVLNGNGVGITGLTLGPANGGTGTVSLTASNSTVCPSHTYAGAIEVSAAGNSGLQDLGGGNYQFNWKTSLPSGACVDLAVDPGDGTLHHALFQAK